MINSVHGDLLESKRSHIVIPVNTVGVLGAGLAKSWKDAYPHLEANYVSACERGVLVPGTIWPIWDENGTGKCFVMFPTKKRWQDESQLEYIVEGLIDLLQKAEWSRETGLNQFTDMAFPKIGCGLGRLSWPVVRPILTSFLRKMPEGIYDIYEHKASASVQNRRGQQAL